MPPLLSPPEDTSLTAWTNVLDQLSRQLGQRPPDEVCCDGLTPRQCQVLRILVEQEGSRLTDLAQQTGVTSSGLTRQLDRLEAEALIQRVRGGPGEGRNVTVLITPRGRAVKTKLDQNRLDAAAALVEALPESQRATVLSSLRLLLQVLNGTGCCDAPMQSCCTSTLEE